MISKESVVTAITTAALLAGALFSATLISTSVAASDMKSHNHSHMKQHAGMSMAEVVTTEGVVSRIDRDAEKLIVHHQPIPEWKMSEMQMKFGLAPGLSVSDFSEGQKIRFRLKQENMMKFTITEVLK